MDDLGRHGWRVDTAEESQDMEDVDMKAMFLDADVQRRDSVELLVAPPRRVGLQISLSNKSPSQVQKLFFAGVQQVQQEYGC